MLIERRIILIRTELFHGVIPPVATLFKDGTIDEAGMKSLIDFLINSGVNGLFFLGSGGEFASMSTELRKQVAEFTVNYVNGRVPVLIGTGSPSTSETISLSQHAKEVGADGVVIINPYYYKLSENHLLHHYIEIANSVELPIILYNFPDMTGQDLSPDFVRKLVSECTNIIGIKETVSDMGHIREMIQTVKPAVSSFKVFCGYDDHFFNTLTLGGDGSIGLTANFAPELQVGLYHAFKNENYHEAMTFHQKIAKLVQIYKLDTPFFGVIKEAINFRGIHASIDVLSPVQSLSKDKQVELQNILTDIFNVKVDV
jgi:4-hydroxy-tetrahydrodipicolinate synthase